VFRQYQHDMHKQYIKARDYYVLNFERLLKAEEFMTHSIAGFLSTNIEEISADYNEASCLYPFWKNYPPEDRGRQPIGDQFPWIEVGEHVFPPKINRFLTSRFRTRDCGLPGGPDQRVVLTDNSLREILGITDSLWLFLDVKSVGPRDDQPHAVMSHNQISGDGIWTAPSEGVKNTRLIAKGIRTEHDFWCAMPPIYVLSNGTILPVIHIVIKVVYGMPVINNGDSSNTGQPLERVTVVCIPNGVLLTMNPGYINQYPTLLFPGKDDKRKNPRKLRARISFPLLAKLDSWRVLEINAH